MILQFAHLAASVAMITRATLLRTSPTGRQAYRRRAFPFVVALGVTGCLCVGSNLMEIFVGLYSGAPRTTDLLNYLLTGPYAWFFVSESVLPLLPILLLLPALGSRHWVTVAFSVLAALPALLLVSLTLLRHFT